MKLACQAGLLPGNSVSEKFDSGKRFGFEAIEITGRELLETPDKVKEVEKASINSGISISTICAGYRHFLLEPSPGEREMAITDIKKLLEMGARLKVVGLILVPIFGPPKISDLTPYLSSWELEKKLLMKLLPSLVEFASSIKCSLLLEPLNRYETHFLNRLEQAVEICKEIDNPYIKIMADFFHMNIEEADISQSIEKAGKWISHIHLADSNRVLPGMGHIDFRPGFAVLKRIGYKNFMALECGVPEPREENLKKSIAFLKNLLS